MITVDFSKDVAENIAYGKEQRGLNGERALTFLIEQLHSKAIIFSSDLHIIELKRLGYPLSEIRRVLEKATKQVHINKQQTEQAKHIASLLHVPNGDVLHALIARDNDAILVSNDRDFQKLTYLVEIKTIDG